MRHPVFVSLGIVAAIALAACQKQSDEEIKRAAKAINVVDESNLNDIMLTVADPNEAVAYFARTAAEQPERVDLKRGLARSLVRANRPAEAASVWAVVVASPEGGNGDRVGLADALIRANEWKKAETELNKIPPTHESFDRYRLEAMVADANKQWDKADSFYQTAAGMTTTPAGVLNNWGYSKLTRGDYPGAEKKFVEALTHDDSMFTAKNNLVLARAAQRRYDLPLVKATQTERAMLYYTAALAAIKQGDVIIGKGLLQTAIETHPQHFEEAVRALQALDANVTNG